MTNTQPDAPNTAPFQVAALALAWRSLEAAQRVREQRLAALGASDFETAEQRASLISALDAETEAQMLLAREIVTLRANDLTDVLHKLAVLREAAGDALPANADDDLLGSIIRDVERLARAA